MFPLPLARRSPTSCHLRRWARLHRRRVERRSAKQASPSFADWQKREPRNEATDYHSGDMKLAIGFASPFVILLGVLGLGCEVEPGWTTCEDDENGPQCNCVEFPHLPKCAAGDRDGDGESRLYGDAMIRSAAATDAAMLTYLTWASGGIGSLETSIRMSGVPVQQPEASRSTVVSQELHRRRRPPMDDTPIRAEVVRASRRDERAIASSAASGRAAPRF